VRPILASLSCYGATPAPELGLVVNITIRTSLVRGWCAVFWRGNWVLDKVVPEGWEDLACEGGFGWFLQAKSRQERVGDFSLNQVAGFVLDLAQRQGRARALASAPFATSFLSANTTGTAAAGGNPYRVPTKPLASLAATPQGKTYTATVVSADSIRSALSARSDPTRRTASMTGSLIVQVSASGRSQSGKGSPATGRSRTSTGRPCKPAVCHGVGGSSLDR
jgi:hypothetical protein